MDEDEWEHLLNEAKVFDKAASKKRPPPPVADEQQQHGRKKVDLEQNHIGRLLLEKAGFKDVIGKTNAKLQAPLEVKQRPRASGLGLEEELQKNAKEALERIKTVEKGLEESFKERTVAEKTAARRAKQARAVASGWPTN